MNLDLRLNVLKKIYRLYDDFFDDLEIACKKYCDGCCSLNVTMTTLEGYLIADHMVAHGPSDGFQKVQKAVSQKRFKPQTTTNRLSELCFQEKDLPEEKNHEFNGSCPLLKDGLCPIYAVRPFGCRCFVSKHDCRTEGYADVDPFVITVNTLFLQVIEHVDIMGFSGNFTDVLLLMASRENRDRYELNRLKTQSTGLISNLELKVLMIPPEHRIKVKPVLNALLNLSS